MSLYPAGRNINNWFNLAAFATPAKDTWGNLGRNVGRGPGYYEIDTALEKEIPLTERLKLEFRAEAFNLLNHPIYGDPDSDVSDGPGEFGVITSQLNSGATGHRLVAAPSVHAAPGVSRAVELRPCDRAASATERYGRGPAPRRKSKTARCLNGVSTSRTQTPPNITSCSRRCRWPGLAY